MSTEPYNPGDRVTVCTSSEGATRILTVVRSGPRKTTLDDGSEWVTRTGSRWGRSSNHWGGSWIRRESSTDARKIERDRLARSLKADAHELNERIHRFDWRAIDLDRIRALRATARTFLNELESLRPEAKDEGDT